MRVESVCQHSPQSGRRGSYTLELTLLLPIIVGILFAVVYFAVLIATQQQLMAASAEGARVASRGGDQEAIKEAVEAVLGNGRLSEAQIIINEKDEAGNPLESGDPIEVKVEIKTDCVFPNVLAFFAVGADNDTLVGRSIRQLE